MWKENSMACWTKTRFSIILVLLAAFIFTILGCDDSEEKSRLKTPFQLEGPSWMYYSANIIGQRRLNEIAIPGTHDSGTYSITSSSAWADDGKGDPVEKWVNHQQSKWYGAILDVALDKALDKDKDITAGWSKTQRHSFATQLTDGIRYFDLRIQQSGGDWYIVHALKGCSIDELLNAIVNFYNNPDSAYEILILDFQHTYDMDHDVFIAHLKSKLVDSQNNSILIPRNADITINSIWQTNKRVLVMYDNDATVDKYPELWHSSSSKKKAQAVSTWANTGSGNKLKKFLTNQLSDKTVKHQQWSGDFFILQAIATETLAEVGGSAAAYIYDQFGDNWLIGPIMRKLGWNKTFDEDFFDWNPGLRALKEWFSDSNNLALAGKRAGIIIIDDYANFSYHSGDVTKNYLELIYELNSIRNQPSPTGYKAVIKSQTPNFLAPHYKYSPVEIRMRNVGQNNWDQSAVFLGTADPYDRITNLKDPDPNSSWVLETRIKSINTQPVNPGEDMIFQFNVYPDYNYGTSFQTFELVSDVSGTPSQWFGEDYGGTSMHILTDPLVYKAQIKAMSPPVVMPQFDTQEFYVIYTNTGNMPWFHDVVRLGTEYNSDWDLFNSLHNFDDTNVVEFSQNYARIQMQDDGPVMPGQDATFRFTLTANFGALPNSGVVFNLVADKALGLAKAGWFSDDSRTFFDVEVNMVTDPGALSAYVAYQDPKNVVIKRGESASAFLEIINTGKIVWPPDTVVLATTNPNLRMSHLYTQNDSWASQSYIFMSNDTPVMPNGAALFYFSLTPDDQFVSGDEQFQLYVSVPYVASWWIPSSLVTFHVTVTD